MDGRWWYSSPTSREVGCEDGEGILGRLNGQVPVLTWRGYGRLPRRFGRRESWLSSSMVVVISLGRSRFIACRKVELAGHSGHFLFGNEVCCLMYQHLLVGAPVRRARGGDTSPHSGEPLESISNR